MGKPGSALGDGELGIRLFEDGDSRVVGFPRLQDVEQAFAEEGGLGDAAIEEDEAGEDGCAVAVFETMAIKGEQCRVSGSAAQSRAKVQTAALGCLRFGGNLTAGKKLRGAPGSSSSLTVVVIVPPTSPGRVRV